MIVIINALSQVGAGSRTYLTNVLPRLASSNSSIKYIVLWPRGKHLLPSLPENQKMSFIKVKLPQKPFFLRLLYDQFVVPIIAKYGDVLFEPVDIAPLHSPCPVVLAIRNPNPFFNIHRPFLLRNKLWLKRKMISMCGRKADRIIFVSEHSRQHILRRIGIPMNHTQVIYHGILQDKFNPSSSDYSNLRLNLGIKCTKSYILSISTISFHKNYEVLIKGYSLLSNPLKNAHHLVIAGRVSEVDYYHYLKRLAYDLGLNKFVHFIGEFPYSNIQHLYFGAYAFILPALLETFGHTLVEAMASGVPVLASNVSCIPEITQEAALLFDPSNPSDLAEKLERILTHQEIRRRLTLAGFLRAKDFSWDETVRKLEDVFQSVSK